MAVFPFKMTRIGLVGDSAVVLSWLKAEGEKIERGEPIVEVESEKSTVEMESPVSGILKRIICAEGETVEVDDLMAEITISDEEPLFSPEEKSPESYSLPEVRKSEFPEPQVTTVDKSPVTRIIASPAAKRMAREHSVDLKKVVGSGPGGRIQLNDVEDLVKPSPKSGNRIELRHKRRVLARAMVRSETEIPQFTVSRTVSWDLINKIRKQNEKNADQTVILPTINDFLIQAVSRALMLHKSMNAVFVGNPEHFDAHIRSMDGAHIGMVVAASDGLYVPVLHHVEVLTLGEITELRTDVVSRGRTSHLQPEEMSGASISISNLGKDGPDRFTALINPGESAILAVGRSRNIPVVSDDGSMDVCPSSELTLTADHRLIDGRDASEFLHTIIDVLEGQG